MCTGLHSFFVPQNINNKRRYQTDTHVYALRLIVLQESTVYKLACIAS